MEPNLNSSESDPEDRLIRILADMLSSALAWEAQRTCKFRTLFLTWGFGPIDKIQMEFVAALRGGE